MLIKNIVPGLVNGSCGRIIEFITIHEAMKRHIRIAELKGGQREHDDDDDDDEPGLGLSKPKRSGPPPEFVPLNEVIYSPTQEWPLVEFTSGDMLLCAPVDFTVEGFMGNVEAKRTQVPLILAWALSIHKSQGQTLQRVKIDLGRVFEKGQAYVAISRATTMEHLEIVNFNPAKVEAHPRVIAWQRQHVPPASLSQVHAAPSQATSSQAQAVLPQVVQPQAAPSTPMRTVVSTVYPKTPKTPIELDEELWAEMDSDYAVRQYFTLYDR
ncbi:DNA helicase [Stygiomarasmius scandens]|uniref:DNA helicase n=1 Tax=Marasmiellus scandens TaxID=2682957 RepID=A0ABR1JXQ3_9AGAR